MRPKKNKGYTFIELIMVMVIIGIISVVSVTRIIESSTLSFGINLATIKDHIRFAADYALSRSVTTVVSFDVANNRYSIFKEDLSGRTLLINPETNSDFVIQLGDANFDGVILTNIDVNSTNEIKFYSYGVPFDANDIKISSQAFLEINSQNAITIYPVSGYCSVLK
ncbi:MAG: prepilin-type N-terminal cleavage/methylation domain-containing protein [Candidatus Aureabacteria bacterium]|nr:prepilin-type N-terminal cleavage/methylation domain-containing protein [Candidatus Auribacterota bacterium]